MSCIQLTVLLLFLLPTVLLAMPTPVSVTPVSVTPGRASGGLQADEGPVGGAGDDTSHHEAVGACRATCVEQTLQWPPTDEMCLQSHDCLTCWQLCELLYQDELKWRSMCEQDDCTTGCTTACKFSFTTVDMPDRMLLKFPTMPVTTEVSDTVLHVSWESPLPRGKEATPAGRPYLVYTLLFWDDNNPRWSSVTSTLDFITQVDGHHASFPGLQFLLLASSPAGTMARAVPPYPVAAPPTPAPTPAPTTTPAVRDPTPTTLQVAVYSTQEGALETEVTWGQEADVRLTYVVTWGRQSCNVDPLMSFCPLPQHEMTAHIKSKDGKEMRVILTQLTYNSRYSLTVSVLGTDYPPAGHTFYTPACARVDATFMTCLPEVEATAPKVALPKVTPTKVPTQEVTQPTTPSPTTSWAAPETTQSADTSTTRENYKSSDRWALSAEVLLLAAGTSVFSVLVVLLSMCIYKRSCGKPDQDMAKVLQSYSHLPLLGANTPQGSLASLHQLHLHNVNQSLLNSSYATPTRAGLLAPGSPFLQLPTYQTPTGAARWHSMDGLLTAEQLRTMATPPVVHPVVHPAPASPAPTVVSINDGTNPPQCRVYVEQRPAPSPASQLEARSMEGLHCPPSHLLVVPALSAARRATSASNLATSATNLHSPNTAPTSSMVPDTQQRARRQIHFADDDLLTEPETATCTGRRAIIPAADAMYHYLHTVPEEGEEEADLSDLLAAGEESVRAGRPPEWEYEDFQLQTPFRGRTETM